MICAQLLRMFTPRNVMVLLFFEVSFSFMVAINSSPVTRPGSRKPIRPPKQPTGPRKCRLIEIANGKSQLFNQKTVIRYTCENGYKLYGIHISTCNQNGQWSHAPPACVAPECSTIQIANDGPLTMASVDPYGGAVLSFSCASGFYLRGYSTIFCSRKSWSKRQPKCIAIPDSATLAVEEGPVSSSVPDPTLKTTTQVKSVKTITSSYPSKDESLTREYDETPLSATVGKANTSAASRTIIVSLATKAPSSPMSTRVASSTVESDLPISTTTTAELPQSVDFGDLTSHSTLEAEESTAPPSVQVFASFPDDVTDELTEDHRTSMSEMFHQDEETKRSDIPATEKHKLLTEKPNEEEEEEEEEEEIVSTIDAFQTAQTRSFSSAEMVSDRETPDEKTPETLTSSSVTALLSEERSEDGETESESLTSESVSPYTAASENNMMSVQMNISRTQVPISDAETLATSEQSLIYTFRSEESDDVTVPFERDSTARESDADSLRSLIVTQLFDREDYEQDPQTTTPSNSILTENPGSDDSSTETQTESSSDETLVLRTEKMPTPENKTVKSRLRSQSVLTTHVPPSNLAGSKSIPASASSVDSSPMTAEDNASVVLIVIIVIAIIVLVVLLSFLGKALRPKCSLRPKPYSREHVAVPYEESTNQSNQVLLKAVTTTDENNSCTRF